MTTEYPEHILDRPTEADYERLEAIRLQAEADPLEGGQQIEWIGPQLEEDVLPPSDYPHTRSTSPNPLRALHSLLVDPQLGPSGRPWLLTLTEALQTGSHQWSQVWRARATRNDSESLPIVVKFYQQSRFPEPDGFPSSPRYDRWNWRSAKYIQEREALVYRRARDHQGSDIPLCYGFYRFWTPTGEEIVGVVLEDLVESGRAIPLEEYFEREVKGNRLTAAHFNLIACEALRMQNRFLEHGVVNTSYWTDKFVYLRSSASSTPVLVGIGFGEARSKEMHMVDFRDAQEARGAADEDWCQQQQHCLYGALTRALSGKGERWSQISTNWAAREMETQTLGFLRRPW